MKDKISLRLIGLVHSPFTEQPGTPIQPSLAGGAEGWAEVYPEYEAGLKDLEGFERVWLIYWFDRAGPAKLEVTPYLDRETHGVFSTRAPTRPNKIGLSSVKLLRREGCRLFLAGVDILDNTPLLDIKPYVPDFDVFEAGRTGWLDKRLPEQVRADSRFAQEK
ncbi:MAG: tRNA (N6-threonylcarbamoyladenosine(37)-N6)-methyltransferase TrmO [Candidatus Glassbacteria bacterium]|nr:tRNA (N6-threonylcarbamoyladenosine(37)-N6)-methyltransferase TrmO [Candidatus Glassbacteria bacterium]